MSRESYLCSEGRDHYNENYAWGYQPLRAPSLITQPPTIITYNVKEEINREDIQSYVNELVESKLNIITKNISDLVYSKLSENVDLTVQEAVQQAFLELDVISEEDINNITQG